MDPQGYTRPSSGEREGEKGPHLLVNAQGLIADNTISSDISFRIPGLSSVHGDVSSVASFSRRNGDLVTHLAP